MRRPSAPVVRRLALAGGALLAAVAVTGGAAAQTVPSGQFGGFQVSAAGEGVSIAYNSPGLIPGTPSPLIQISLPEAISSFDGGPNGYALASVAYPGPLLADLPTLLAVAGFATPLPAYPVRTQSFYPSGPPEAQQSIGAAQMRSRTAESGSDAFAGYTSAQLPGILTIGAITSQTDTHVEDGQVVSRVRVELGGLDLLAGLIHIDSVVTDLVATSNGADSGSDGSTTVAGASVLGLPVTIDATGIHFTQPPASPSTTAGNPIGDPLDPLGLGAVGEALQPVADAISGLLTSVLGTANAALEDLFAASGISLRVLDPVEVRNGPNATRTGFGLQLSLHYDGETTPLMSQLLDLIPVEQLPSQGIDPIPLTSPQDLVLALKATHVFTIGFAPATVTAQATPPFVASPRTPTPAITTGGGTTSTPSLTPSGFATPAPTLGSGAAPSVGDALPLSFPGADPLAGAAVLLALLLTAGVAWVGSGRLADNVLSAAGSSCPKGLDGRIPAGSGP